MIIKVCGMRDADNIRAVSELGIDLMGFIFYPESSRYVQMINSGNGVIPDYVDRQLVKSDNSVIETKRPKRVGVFVDEMPQSIITRIYNYNLDYIQLHGSESRVMIDNLRRTLDPDIHPGIKIIKALSISCKEDISKYKEYEDVVDLFLFDTKCNTVGGSGEHFDWSVLDAYDGEIPFLLSGGIGPDDAERILEFHHPRMVGVDLNSKFEISPALKDVDKLRKFIHEVDDRI